MKNNNLQPVRQAQGEKGFTMPVIIAVIALVIIIVGIGYFVTRMRPTTVGTDQVPTDKKTLLNDTDIKTDGAMVKPDEAMIKKDDGAMIVKYTGTVLAGKSAPLLDFVKADYDAAVKSDKLIILYFYANWCPICRVEFPQTQAAFNELTDDKVVGFRVNYKDNETDTDEKNIAREFGVPYQHTKVFLKNGKQILKAPDSWSKDRYLLEINKVIAQ